MARSQGVGAGDEGDKDTQNDAGQIGVLGAAVKDAGQNHGQRQDDQHGEQPDALHVVGGPGHVAAGQEGDVLDEQQHGGGEHRGDGQQQGVDPAVLAAHIVVVEAAGGHGVGHVVHEEEQHVPQGHPQLLGIEGADGQRPHPEVGHEEVVGHGHTAEAGGHHDQGQQDGLAQLARRDLQAHVGQIHAVLLAVGKVADEHADDADHAAGGRPGADAQRLTLGPADVGGGVGGHGVHDGQVDDGADDGADDDAGEEPGLAGLIGLAGGHQFVGADLGEEGLLHQHEGQDSP